MSESSGGRRMLDIIMPVTWLVILAGIVALPYLAASPTLDDDLTRATVRLSLVYYAAAATLMLLLDSKDWTAVAGRGRMARWCWTLAWATYLVHLFMAFHHVHRWSH